MALDTYANLKLEVASFINRTDLTSQIDTFIDLAEGEMQRILKLVEFESSATLTFTAGVASLPADFVGARSLLWNADPQRTLHYRTPDQLNAINARAEPGVAYFYTITGDQVKLADDMDGTATMIYMARFTPLDNTNTTNFILTNHPGAYLYGALKHASVYLRDTDGAAGYGALFDAELSQVRLDNTERKYAGATLEVKPA